MKTVADSDLRSAKYASKLCESFNINTSETTPEPEKTLDASTEPTEKEGD